MHKSETKSRREFFAASVVIGGVALASGGYFYFRESDKGDTGRLWRLNPAFRIQEISPLDIILSTNLGNGQKLQHRFKGIEADLLREVAKENVIAVQISIMARKHQLSENECRSQLDRYIKELAQAKLIYTGEKMLVKIVEVSHG